MRSVVLKLSLWITKGHQGLNGGPQIVFSIPIPPLHASILRTPRSGRPPPAFQSQGKITTCSANTGASQPFAITNSCQSQGPGTEDHKRGEEQGGQGGLQEGAGTKERERRAEEQQWQIRAVEGSWGQWSTKPNLKQSIPWWEKIWEPLLWSHDISSQTGTVEYSEQHLRYIVSIQNTVLKNHPPQQTSSSNKKVTSGYKLSGSWAIFVHWQLFHESGPSSVSILEYIYT